MIGEYVQHGYNGEALKLFQQMEFDGFEPDVISFINILSACTSLAQLSNKGGRFMLISTEVDWKQIYFWEAHLFTCMSSVGS